MDTSECVTVSRSVREQLDCPVCFKIMLPPIHQCSNGHTLCSDCKPKVHNQCPTCRHELGNIRCMTLEKSAASLNVPCKYEDFGCSGTYTYDNMLNHVSNCIYRPYNCPGGDRSECKVTGSIPSLVAHLKGDHQVRVINGSTFTITHVIDDSIRRRPLVVVRFLDQHFCLHVNVVQLGKFPVIIAFVQFMGDDNEAKNYGYDVEVVGRQGWRKYCASWEGITRSMRDSRDRLEGAVIQRDIASERSDHTRIIRLSGKIWSYRLL